MSVFFDGQLLETPTTASAVNDDAMLNQNLTVGNVVAFVGVATGGQPQTVLRFGTPDEARNVLKSGELCDAVVSAFAPSQQTGSPGTVLAVRVNDSTPAFLDLLGTSGKTFATLRGKSYSNADKMIRVKVERGQLLDGSNQPVATTPVKLVNITVDDGKGNTYFGENVNYSPMMIDIKLDNVVFSVTSDRIELTIEKGQPNQSVHEIYFDQFPTLADLVTRVNAINTAAVELTIDNLVLSGALPSSMFDRVSYGSKGSHYMFANMYTIKTWFEQKTGVFLDFVPGSDPVYFNEEPVVMPYTALSQPAGSAPLPADWESALTLLDTKDVQWLQVVSGNPAIHAKCEAHVHLCSTTLKRERRSVCGTVVGTSDTDAIAQAKSLNSKRTSLVHIGHYKYNDAGKLELRPAYMTAALVAAAFAGLAPGEPMTNKSLQVNGLERDVVNPTETDVLLRGGVMPIENTDEGYKVTQSITTWLGDSKYNNREQSCGVAIDFTQRNMRQALDPIRGSKQSPLLLSRGLSIAKTTLTELAREEPNGPGVLVGNDDYPPFRNITGTVVGDVLRIQYEASPAIPNNYILLTMYARPYSGSATV